MRIAVNPEVCQGHTLCAMTAPDLFELRDEDGHAEVVGDGTVPPELEAVALEAIHGCPEQAIREL